jgi:sporulation protein YlmC with PRC-barrel domain
MKTTLGKRAALIAVLALGSSTWLNAADGLGGSPIGGAEAGAPLGPQLRLPVVRTTNQGQVLEINKSSTLIGATVKNQQGEKLGKIRDLVIDLNSERVAYAVLGSPGMFFSAEKLQAVPLRALQPDATGTSLILNASKENLASSPGFDKANWPEVGTAVWGAEPFWKENQRTNGTYQATNDTLRVREPEPQIRENTDAAKEPYKTEPEPKP